MTDDSMHMVMIPFYVHEGEVTRLNKIIKKLWVLVLVVFVALILTNAGWIVYESQFATESYSYSVSQDSGDGGSVTYADNVVKIGGEINGEADSNGNRQAPGQ
ncbi:MAG: hypothetical protein J6N19_04915 [Clostridium sp.]|nr:hypothetical protein [Clostridium sp.]